MIKKLLFCFLLIVLISACSSSKKVVTTKVKETKEVSLADKIIWTAVSYKGTPYKYGGTSTSGMDCSGLIYTSFKKRGEDIPRVSYMMAKEGKSITIKNVKKGDLLFFKTKKTANRINHVGLVTSVGKEIKFIHSTSSRGVIVSSLNNRYWKKAFVKAKRVL